MYSTWQTLTVDSCHDHPVDAFSSPCYKQDVNRQGVLINIICDKCYFSTSSNIFAMINLNSLFIRRINGKFYPL